jgi:hypothetical protein
MVVGGNPAKLIKARVLEQDTEVNGNYPPTFDGSEK